MLSLAALLTDGLHFPLHIVQDRPPVQVVRTGEELRLVLGACCPGVSLPILDSVGQMIHCLLVVSHPLLVCAVVGTWIGTRLLKRMDQRIFGIGFRTALAVLGIRLVADPWI